MRPKAIQFFASAFMGSAFAMCALIAGAVSQFYSDPIKRGFPLHAFGNPERAALVFWVFVFLTAATGIAYYAASGHMRDAEVKSLQSHTSELVETLRTQPPEGFMRVYGRLCASMMKTYTAALADPSPDGLRHGIRVALYTAAELAKVFDRGEPGETYSANVMAYRSVAELGDPAAWSEEQLTLYPPGFRPAKILGALVLDPLLTTSSESRKAEPVPGMKAIRIAIPDPVEDTRREGEHTGRLRMLPGGAAALHLGAPFHVPDARYMRETMRSLFSLEEALISCSEHYFRTGEGRSVRSFVSLPLFEDPGDMKGPRVGVLNVESSDRDIFEGNESRIEQFYLALAPVRYVLWVLLGALDPSESAYR